MDKLDCPLGAPSGLVVLLGDAVLDVIRRCAAVEFLPRCALGMQPLRVGVLGPVRLRVVRPVKDAVAVVDACLDDAVGAGGEVQFAAQTAGVACVGEQAADQFFVGRQRLAVLAALGRPRVTTGHECRTAGGADRALGVRLGERHALANQVVNARSVDVRVAQRADGVVPLLVGANPEHIRPCARHGSGGNRDAALACGVGRAHACCQACPHG